MTDRLGLYNSALVFHIGANPLTALTDDRPEREALDIAWDANAVKTCLEMGQWNFAIRSQRKEFEPSVTPEYGYQYAFEKPSDFVRTASVCSDEYFEEPIKEYTDEVGYWWCDLQQIYVRFVSDDAQFGLDYSKWPQNFTRMVEAYLAMMICKRTSYAEKFDDIAGAFESWKTMAKATDAMEQPSRKNPAGSWRRARGGGGYSDYGSNRRLTG